MRLVLKPKIVLSVITHLGELAELDDGVKTMPVILVSFEQALLLGMLIIGPRE